MRKAQTTTKSEYNPFTGINMGVCLFVLIAFAYKEVLDIMPTKGTSMRFALAGLFVGMLILGILAGIRKKS